MSLISARSIITPPSVRRPATLCPPPLTEHFDSTASGKGEGRDDVLGAPRAHDQRRLTVNEAVVYGASRVIARVIGGAHRTGDLAYEPIEKMVVQRGAHVVPFC